jgi:SAM-dependent methyltransferase
MPDPERLTNREALRRLFLHQDGLVLGAALAALHETGVISRLRAGPVAFSDIVMASAHPAVSAASLLAVQGAGIVKVADGPGGPRVHLPVGVSDLIAAQLELCAHVRRAVKDSDWEDRCSIVSRLRSCVDALNECKRAVIASDKLSPPLTELALRYLEGMLASCILPATAMEGDVNEDEGLLGLLGIDPARAPFFAPMYGLTGSYAEALFALPQWMSAKAAITPAAVNARVDRELNAIASGAAHRAYFRAADVFIRQVFSQPHSRARPRAIMDIGCGDGTWLRHIHDLLQLHAPGTSETSDPTLLIAVDLDERALAVARRNLSGLPAICLQGDVSNVPELDAALGERTGLALDEVLTVRAFVDHNRAPRASTQPVVEVEERFTSYLDLHGGLIAEKSVVRDWVAHYSSWARVAGANGLIVIEAHLVAPQELSGRPGTSNGLAFQFCHLLSGQSPLSLAAFTTVAAQAGLVRQSPPKLFPNVSTPSISVQHFGLQ